MYLLNLNRQIHFWQGVNYVRSKFFIFRNYKVFTNFIEASQYLKVYPNRCSKFFASDVNSSHEINKEVFINKIIGKLSSRYQDDLTKSKILPQNFLNYIQKSVKQVNSYENEIKELEIVAKDESDSKIEELMKEEINELNDKVSHLKESIYDKLVDNFAFQDVDEFYLEITAGAGGQEAMLFAQNLMDMYYGYCSLNGWSADAISFEYTPLGGVRNACLLIKGQNSYENLKFESGIHRVQRVPKTEKGGRIHTSTASVAILPMPSEINIEMSDKDLLFEFRRASGPGGQNVNKSNSAVRLTHLPTGIVVDCQIVKTQEGNKKEALRKLRAKLYEIQTDKQMSEVTFQRKLQTGTKARSEKIRTYNFTQDRVTDHRVGISIHNINDVMGGGTSLQKLTTELMKIGKMEKLKEILNIRD